MGNMIERRSVEANDAICDLECLFEIADEDESGAFGRMTTQRIDDIGACPGIHALKRFVQQ
jgi:hypothetical protein